jgi:hypothetical protein
VSVRRRLCPLLSGGPCPRHAPNKTPPHLLQELALAGDLERDVVADAISPLTWTPTPPPRCRRRRRHDGQGASRDGWPRS